MSYVYKSTVGKVEEGMYTNISSKHCMLCTNFFTFCLCNGLNFNHSGVLKHRIFMTVDIVIVR